jgi:pimeloyl-ACP methyl ester carboxylesterase
MSFFQMFRLKVCFPLLCVIALCHYSYADGPESIRKCEYVTLSIPAPSLAGNRTGEASEQATYVYLPPSYKDSDARYPVLYFFAGYYDSSDISCIAAAVSLVMKEREFIIVSINDVNSLHGSFGANSVVIGNWRDFFLRDAIPYIDSHFRTIPTADGRIAAGFSMGGHVALRLAFEHPEVFSALYALSPGVFDEHGLEHAMKTWDPAFLNAYGAAYAPNLSKPYPHADYPIMDGSAADMAIRAMWNKGFGELPALLDAYLSQPVRLKAVAIEVGSSDEYPWIPDGCMYFNDLLCRKGLAHTFVMTNHHHEFNAEIFRVGMGRFAAGYFSSVKP